MDMMAKALFGFGKFDTVFGDVTSLPMYVLAMNYIKKSFVQGDGKAIDMSEEHKAQLDKELQENAEKEEEKLVAELVIMLKQKVSIFAFPYPTSIS